MYRNLRVIGRYFFFQNRWSRPIIHIDLFMFFFSMGGGWDVQIFHSTLYLPFNFFFINFALWDIFLPGDPFPAVYIRFDWLDKLLMFKIHPLPVLPPPPFTEKLIFCVIQIPKIITLCLPYTLILRVPNSITDT